MDPSKCVQRQQNFGYTVDFGSNDIHQVVVPTLYPKVFEKIGQAVANTKSKQNLDALREVTNILIETQLEESSPSWTHGSAAVNKHHDVTPTSVEKEILINTMRPGPASACSTKENQENFDFRGSTFRNESIKSRSKSCKLKTGPYNFIKGIFKFITLALIYLVSFTGIVHLSCVSVDYIINALYYLLLKPTETPDDIEVISHHTVKSIEKYNELVISSNKDELLAIHIEVSSFADWPSDVKIPACAMVLQLFVRGLLHIKKIINLISTTKHLKKLRLDNIENELCAESHQNATITTIEFENQITHIEFVNFSPVCSKVYDTISETIRPKTLIEFKFNTGMLESGNEVKDILRNNRQTLQHIEFNNSTSRECMFYKNKGNFPRLKKLVLDIPLESCWNNFDESIVDLFPNLEHLSFGSQFKSMNNLTYLYGLKSLKDLRINIKMPPDSNIFNVSFLGLNFNSLVTAEIMVQFQKCAEHPHSNSVLGKKHIPRKLRENVRITTPGCNNVEILD